MKNSNHEDRDHALLPPSASSRWINCVPSMAYVRALIEAKIIKKRVSGDAAQRGTRIHQWGEQFIRWRLKGKNTTSVAAKDSDEKQEQVEAREYAEHCVEMFEHAKVLDSKAICGLEDRAILVDGVCWGSRDFWVFAARRLTMLDLKSGFETVGVVDNTQLIIYAIGKFEELDEADEIDEVEIAVWQPNADDGGEPFRSHIYTAKEVRAWAKKLRAHADESHRWFGRKYRDMEKAMTGGPWCKWCDALGVCPEARRYNQEISRESFMPVTPAKTLRGKGKEVAVVQNRLPSAADMTPEQVGEILARAPLFSEWLDAVKVHALELMQKGKKVPGFKPVAKNTRYAWESKLTPQAIATKLGLRRSDVVEEKTLSPAKVREKVKDKKKRGRIASMTWRPFEVTIAKETDRRMAIPSTKISFQPVSKSEEYDE